MASSFLDQCPWRCTPWNASASCLPTSLSFLRKARKKGKNGTGVEIFDMGGHSRDFLAGQVLAVCSNEQFLFVASLTQLRVYDPLRRSIVCVENIEVGAYGSVTVQVLAMDLSPQGDLLLLNSNSELVSYKVTRL